MTRLTGPLVVAYVLATASLLGMAAAILLGAEGTEVWRTATWQLIARLMWVPGVLWLATAWALIVLAYFGRARSLAAAIAATFVGTGMLIYAWADAIAFEGGGSWDILRGVTMGGVYPLVATASFVVIGAVLTILGSPGVRQTGTAR